MLNFNTPVANQVHWEEKGTYVQKTSLMNGHENQH
jgi:hypothetical protein